MAKYMIIRIGIPFPTERESQVIMDICDGEIDPIGGPIIPPGKKTPISGIVSIISSSLTADEISDRFQSLSTEDDDSVEFDEKESFPTMVFKIGDGNFSYTRDMANHLGYGEILKDRFDVDHSENAPPKKVMWTLNDLLDIMNEKGGYDNLSDEEKSALKEFKS
jgi:hypothetical protein